MPTLASPDSAPVAVVTGASQGIGAAICECFATRRPGVRLALVARNREKLQSVAARCSALGAAQVEIFQADLADPTQVERMAASVHSVFGYVDTLINNAG